MIVGCGGGSTRPQVSTAPIGDAGTLSPATTEAPPPDKISSAPMPAPACPDECLGSMTSELMNAISTQARAAKRCYNLELAVSPNLETNIGVAIRIAPNGAPCSVDVFAPSSSEKLDHCVAGILGSGAYPAPNGGCINVNVPIRFKKPTP